MIIKNISILSFTDLSIKEEMDIVIEQGKIKKIDKGIDTSALSAADVFDGSRLYVIPGLTNNHSHTAMTLLRGVAEDVNTADWFNRYVWIYEQSLTPRDVYVGTLLGAAEMLLSGVTAVADHYFSMDQAFEAYRVSGMRANLAWAVFGMGDDAENQFEKAMDFTKEYLNKDERITLSLGPHSPYLCPDDFLKRVVKKSEEFSLPMHIHVSETEDQVVSSVRDRGMTPVEVLEKTGVLREETILAHAYWATDSDIDLIKKRGAGVAHCAKTYMKFGDVNNFLSRALEAGINIALGSDGSASNNTIDIFETARDAALLAKCSEGNPEKGKIEEILPLMTNGNVIGLKNYGEVEEGAPADLVFINPFTPNMLPGYSIFADILYSLNNRDIEMVMVDGRIVVKKGNILNFNIDDLREEAMEIAARLTSTVSDTPMQQYK